MRPLLAGLLLAAAASTPVGPATAAANDVRRGTGVATPRFVPAAGPVLAGDGAIVWVARRDDAVLDLWQAAPGGAPRRIQRFVGSDTEWLTAPRLAASASAVGLAFTETRARTGRALRTRSYLGGLGRPLALVSSCAGRAPAQRSFDVTDTAAVFRAGPACAQPIVRGLGLAAGTARQLPGGGFATRLAGGVRGVAGRTRRPRRAERGGRARERLRPRGHAGAGGRAATLDQRRGTARPTGRWR